MIIHIDEDHKYSVDGIPVPGVSEILAAGGYGDPYANKSGYAIPEDVMDAARDRGIAIAEAIDALNKGMAIEVDEELEGYIEAYRLFCSEWGFVCIDSEQMVYHPTLHYCGTLDAYGLLNGMPAVIDIKTGSAGLKVWHRYQLVAYADAKRRGKEWPMRVMLHLRPTGKYKAHCFPIESADKDMRIFEACHTLWLAKTVEGLL